MHIIDATLSLLDDRTPTRDQLVRFILLGMEAGITSYQISPFMYEIMEGNLPQGATYSMELSLPDQKTSYVGVSQFFISKTVMKGVTTELQINDLREVMQLRNYSNAEDVLLVGMDDLLCFEYKKTFKDIFSIFETGKVIFSPEDQYDLASATALCFVKAGGKRLLTSFAGIGNKAATEQVLLSLHLFCRYKVNQSFHALSQMKLWMEEVCGEKIPEKMPIIGDRIFWVESGIHVDGIIKNPSNYEPYPPELVGQCRKIVMGKYSGHNSVRMKLQELGMKEVTEEICEQILFRVKEISVKKGSYLSEQEFCEVVGAFV